MNEIPKTLAKSSSRDEVKNTWRVWTTRSVIRNKN